MARPILLLLPFLPAAFSAAYFDNSVNCDYKEMAMPPFEVCAVSEGTTPSPAEIDGELIYLGGWSTTFYITQGLNEGALWTPFEGKDEFDTGIVVDIARDDDDVCTSVTVSGKACQSCEHCGDGADSYSADCTNLPHGRLVDCEPTQFGSVYFPLEESALPGYTPDPTPTPPIEPDVIAVQIQGTSKSGVEACWEVRNANTEIGNKIVLGPCAGEDKNTFILFSITGPDGNTYYQISPKLNDETIITGVRVSDEKAWVRIEESTSGGFDETQSFYALDNGMVGLGVQSLCNNDSCLYVTNQGKNVDMGDPVMLSTEPRLKHFSKNGDNIMTWTFVPAN